MWFFLIFLYVGFTFFKKYWILFGYDKKIPYLCDVDKLD